MSESDRKVQTLKSVVNNLNFALDAMSRSIRIGTNYHCDVAQTPLESPRDCTATPATSFSFKTPIGASVVASNAQVSYCLGSGSTCASDGNALLRSIDGGPYTPLTSSEVQISTLSFYVTGAAQVGVQPKVTILISGKVVVSGSGICGSTAECSEFNLQTSVTQRFYDI